MTQLATWIVQHLLVLLFLPLFQTILAETYQLKTLAGFKANGQDYERIFTSKHAFLKTPCGICFGNQDEIYISDCGRNFIFKIFPNETMIVFGGLGVAGFNQDGYDVKQTMFNSPASVSVAPNNDVWIADSNNDKIRIVSAETRVVTSLPFVFNKPLGVYVSKNNIVYIADSGNNVIKKYDISNKVLTTIAGGDPFLESTYDNVNANSIKIKSPKNIHVVSNGKQDTVYFTDEERVKSIDSNGLYRRIDISPLTTSLNGIFVTSNNEIWTSSEALHFLQMNSLVDSSISTIIGQKNSSGYEGDNLLDSYSNVKFYQPSSLILKDSLIYLVDKTNNCIRKIDLSTKKVSTFSGGLINHALGENIPKFEISPISSINQPCVCRGELYFVEQLLHVRKVSNEDGLVKTVFGASLKLQTETSPTRTYKHVVGLSCFPNGDLVIVGAKDFHILNLDTLTMKRIAIDTQNEVASIVGYGDSFANSTIYILFSNFEEIYKYENETLTDSSLTNLSVNNLVNLNKNLYFISAGVLVKVDWKNQTIDSQINFPIAINFAVFDSKNGIVYVSDGYRIYEAKLEELTLNRIAGLETILYSGQNLDFYGYSGENVNASQSVMKISGLYINDGIIYITTSYSYIYAIIDGIARTIVGSSPSSNIPGYDFFSFCRDANQGVIYTIDNNVIKKLDEKSGEITSVMPALKMEIPFIPIPPPDFLFVLTSKFDTRMIFSTFDNMIYITDTCRIVQFNPKTLSYQKVAGKQCGNNVISDVLAINSPLSKNNPRGFSVNPSNGDIYLSYSEFFGKIEKSSGKIRVIFKNPFDGFEMRDGIVENGTSISYISSTYSINDDVHYFCSQNLVRVLERLSNGSFSLTTLVGNGNNGYSGDNLPGLSSQISYCTYIHVKQNRDVIFMDNGNSIIRKYVHRTGLVQTIAGQARKKSYYFSGDLKGVDTSLFGLGNSFDFNEKTGESIFFDTGLSNGLPSLIRKLSPVCEGVAQFNPFNNTCDCLSGYYGDKCQPITFAILLSLRRKKEVKRNEIATVTNIEMSDFPSDSIVLSSSLASNMSDNEDALSRYTNMVRIGAGAFGSVFKCTDTKNRNKIKAIKVVKFESFTDLNTIMKEASQLSNIKHPNILKVNDYFITKDNLLCIDMDYYENGDLTRFTKKETCSEEIIRQILKQMLSALNYVHSELSIIHRDIKPSNIFIRDYSGGDIQVVLADFGLAKKYQEMKGQSYVGTPLFMSPEIALGSAYSFNTDIFSLGVSIYQIITQDETTSIGNLLMGSQSSNAESILTKQMKENSQISSELIEIVLKMLDKNQEIRPNAKHLLTLPYLR